MIFDFFDGKCPAMRFEHGRAFFIYRQVRHIYFILFDFQAR